MNPLTVPPKKEKVQNLLISTVCGVSETKNGNRAFFRYKYEPSVGSTNTKHYVRVLQSAWTFHVKVMMSSSL